MPEMQHIPRGQTPHHTMPSNCGQHPMGLGHDGTYKVVEGGTNGPTSRTSIGGWVTDMVAQCSWIHWWDSLPETSKNQLEWTSQWLAQPRVWQWQKSSKQWTVELFKKLWNISWDLWDHCNEALHHFPNACDDIMDSRINDQIQILFQQGLQAITRDSFAFFKTPLETLLTKTRHYKTQWVASVEVAMQQKKHHEHGAYLLEQRLMWHWLGLDNPNESGI